MGKVYRTQLGVKMHCAKNKLPANCAVEVFATNIRFIHIGRGVRRNNIAISARKLNESNVFGKGTLAEDS
jgi:hypothetical protein